MIVVLDYGMGNLRSVERAVRYLGFNCSVQDSLAGATKLIIPGVGAFGAAMERLRPLAEEIRSFAKDRQVLGICLGQQLLFESSEEHGKHEGLGLVQGHVKYLPASEGIKVPHMGWNSLRQPHESRLLLGIPEDAQVYFVHSLYTECANEDNVAAWTDYGIPFPSAVESGYVWGTQFHPEKSGDVGLKILENFLTW